MLRFMFDQSYGGMYRWHLATNFLVLRVISYCMDLHWSQSEAWSRPGGNAELAQSRETPSEYGSLVATPRPVDEYGYLHFLSYCVYCPLYMAGPVLPFNAYMGQCSGATSRGSVHIPSRCFDE